MLPNDDRSRGSSPRSAGSRLHQSVAATLRGKPGRGSAGEVSRPTAESANASNGDARLVQDVAQALDRLDPLLPLSPDWPERHGFEYYRRGTLSLYAALNTRTGEIIGQTDLRHTSDAFVDFFGDVVTTRPCRREIHVIVESLLAHKTKKTPAFRHAHPRVQLYFTTTYSGWLNQIELWFADIERGLLTRGIFTWLPDLARKIQRSITGYNEDPKLIRCVCSNRAHRITTDSADTGPLVNASAPPRISPNATTLSSPTCEAGWPP